jgi:murein DD-endopeptidase MepM/ murein hydrolase activator NlpD
MAARHTASRRHRRPFFHAVVIGLVIFAAFYASFVPSRAPKTAGAVSDPAAGLSFSGVAVLSKPALRDEVLVMAPTQPRPATTAATQASALPPNATALANVPPNPNDPNVRVTASSINGGLPPVTAPANAQPANTTGGPPGPAPSNVPLPPGLNVPPPGQASAPAGVGPNAAASAAIAPATGNPPNTAAAATSAGGNTPNGTAPAASNAPAPPGTGPSPNAANVSTNPAPSCDSSGSFPIYTIQPGDTLSGVAVKFGLGNGDVPGWKLIVDSNRPDLVDEDDLLQIDQKLLIPIQGCKNPSPAPTAAASTSSSSAAGATDKPATSAATAPTTNNATAPNASSSSAATAAQPAAATASSSGSGRGGLVHTVISSQTLGDIAAMYDVKTTDIVSANSMSDPNKLSIGQQLFIPSPKKSAPPSASIAAPQTASAATSGGSGGSSTSQQSLNTGPGAASGLSWPTSVRTVSSYFSSGHPLGIDIDLYSQPNGPIAAVAAGTVTFAGGNSCCSYGLYVTIDHGNGISTLYAHMSKLNVTTGQKISKGAVIGNGGRTGYATGNHLHFEVRKDGKVVNPLSYLP